MADAGWIEAAGEGEALVLRAGGSWLIGDAAALDAKLVALRLPPAPRVELDLGAIETLDTAGAWLLLRLERSLAARGSAVTIANLAPELGPLLRQVEKAPSSATPPLPRAILTDGLAVIGEGTVECLRIAAAYLGFLGLVVVRIGRTLAHPGRLRLIALVAHMQRVGIAALPIVGLLSFLVGIVTAYQGADQLRRFGAEIYTVDLLGIGFLREMGALLTAIIVAGRSGSAFTAEIGAMKVNEEVDALETLGLDPIELLVIPRLFALMLMLPLLAFFADAMGLGGALMSWLVLDIALPAFLQELHGAVSSWTLWLGIIKAPFFAAAIALVGCNEGLSAESSAESVGRHTTRSVVHSIFLVIVIDAAFSVLFSWLHV